MLKVKQFVFNYFEENTYLAIDDTTSQAAIIDPGMLRDSEKKEFDSFVAENGITLTQIILTHAHLDHCFGADYVKSQYNIPVKAHSSDAPLAQSLVEQANRFGLSSRLTSGIEFDVHLADGDVIEIGQSSLKVIHVPGHSPGGIILYDKEDKLAFVGDSIFEGSVGRTDLAGGNHTQLITSLKNKVLSLPDDTVLLPGHGRPTTVLQEKRHNPFLI